MTKINLPNPRQTKKYGWIPDRPDARDAMLTLEQAPDTTLTKLSLRNDPANPPVWNQLEIGSCTAHGTGRCYAFARAKHLGVAPQTPSRLFIYYFERYLEGTTKTDSGAMVRDGAKVLNKMGVPVETEWPYGDGSKFAKKPSATAISDALKHETTVYRRLAAAAPSLQAIKNALALGFPITFGFTVYESFEDIGKNGIMPMPYGGEGVLGGHCVAMTGFDDANRRFECPNSWDKTWGDGGYFYMPYDYVTSKFCSDFWQFTVAS